jgi:Protein of unknown function (DUF3311)
MATSRASDPEPTSTPPDPKKNPDWSPWLLLLAVPVVLPLIPQIFNRVDPRLIGIPAFYWIQLAFVLMSAAFTGVVYAATRRTRRRPGGDRS